MLVTGRNSIVEKQLQQIFDCLNEPEALAKIQAKFEIYTMKNLVFTLAFMLIGLFASANTNEVVTQKAETIQTISEELIIENSNDFSFYHNKVLTSNSDLQSLADCTLRGKFTITFSDGSKYSWEGTLTIVGQSCAQFLKSLMAD